MIVSSVVVGTKYMLPGTYYNYTTGTGDGMCYRIKYL